MRKFKRRDNLTNNKRLIQHGVPWACGIMQLGETQRSLDIRIKRTQDSHTNSVKREHVWSNITITPPCYELFRTDQKSRVAYEIFNDIFWIFVSYLILFESIVDAFLPWVAFLYFENLNPNLGSVCLVPQNWKTSWWIDFTQHWILSKKQECTVLFQKSNGAVDF